MGVSPATGGPQGTGGSTVKLLGTQPIFTPRLLLRPYTLDDAQAMYDGWMADPEVARWMFWDPYPSVDAVRAALAEWVAQYADPGFCRWSVCLAGGAHIGSIGLNDFGGPGRPRWEPAYNLSRTHWGRGYASEALYAVADFFFTRMQGERLTACHAIGNPASGRVMEKVGFTWLRTGHYTKPDGTPVPARFYALDREDFLCHTPPSHPSTPHG